MNGELKTELRIPDLWYDFYARVLPGAAFVAALKVLVFHNQAIPEVREIVLLIFAGYFCALMTQPVASRLTGRIEDTVELYEAPNKDRLYIRKVQAKLGRTSRESMILSKMHGEVVFFIQLFVLGTLFLIIQLVRCSTEMLGWNIVAVLAFILAALEVASRRLKRAIDYNASTV